VDVQMIRQCVERTVETVDVVVLDWKGIKGADKPKVLSALEEVGVPLERV
jgi:D-tyrosyl-tRNA(Tyr) deacylase